MDEIAVQRRNVFDYYKNALATLPTDCFSMPFIPTDCTPNYHMFYLLMATAKLRDDLLSCLNSMRIRALFHYVPLHSSPMGQSFGYTRDMLPITEDVASRLIRLPMYYQIQNSEQERVVQAIREHLQC